MGKCLATSSEDVLLALRNPTIYELHILLPESENKSEWRGEWEKIFKMLLIKRANSRLRTIVLRNNGIDSEIAKEHIAPILEKLDFSPQLSMDLSHNMIEGEGAIAIVEAIARNPRKKQFTIDLNYNPIKANYISEIFSVLEQSMAAQGSQEELSLPSWYKFNFSGLGLMPDSELLGVLIEKVSYTLDAGMMDIKVKTAQKTVAQIANRERPIKESVTAHIATLESLRIPSLSMDASSVRSSSSSSTFGAAQETPLSHDGIKLSLISTFKDLAESAQALYRTLSSKNQKLDTLSADIESINTTLGKIEKIKELLPKKQNFIKTLASHITSGKIADKTQISFDYNSFDSKDFYYILESLTSVQCPEGLEVSFRGTNIDRIGVLAIACTLISCKKKVLIDISENPIGDDGLKAISFTIETGEYPPNLSLVLQNIRCTMAGIERLALALRSARLHSYPPGLSIDLSYNKITDNSIIKLAEAIRSGGCPEGVTFNLSYNSFSDNGMDAISDALGSGLAPRDLTLVLCGNVFTDKSIGNFVDRLKKGKFPSHLTMDFTKISIGEIFIKKLVEAMKAAPESFCLKLDCSYISPSCMVDLVAIISKGSYRENIRVIFINFSEIADSSKDKSKKARSVFGTKCPHNISINCQPKDDRLKSVEQYEKESKEQAGVPASAVNQDLKDAKDMKSEDDTLPLLPISCSLATEASDATLSHPSSASPDPLPLIVQTSTPSISATMSSTGSSMPSLTTSLASSSVTLFTQKPLSLPAIPSTVSACSSSSSSASSSLASSSLGLVPTPAISTSESPPSEISTEPSSSTSSASTTTFVSSKSTAPSLTPTVMKQEKKVIEPHKSCQCSKDREGKHEQSVSPRKEAKGGRKKPVFKTHRMKDKLKEGVQEDEDNGDTKTAQLN